MNKTISLLITLLIAGSVYAYRYVPAKSCTWSGTWQYKNKKKPGGKINWPIIEKKRIDEVWGVDFEGKTKDKYGMFKISGECFDRDCTIKLEYVKGRLKGSIYEYKGKAV